MVLLLYSVVGYVLVSRRYDGHAFAGTALIVLVTMTPDWDGFVNWLPHRGPTHSIGFALLIGAVLGTLVVIDGYRRGHRARTVAGLSVWAAGLGTFSVLAHLLADALNPAGIRPFYPISDMHVSFDLALASDPIANAGLLAAGLLSTGLCWQVASDRAIHEVPTIPVLFRRIYRYLRNPNTE